MALGCHSIVWVWGMGMHESRYQAKLQQNLMYLAAIADAQPQAVQSSPRVHLNALFQDNLLHFKSFAYFHIVYTNSNPYIKLE